MMKRHVRLIGGGYAGQEFTLDLSKTDILRLPKHPDFSYCQDCADEQPASTSAFHYEEYHVHLLRYGSGHSHVLGIPVGTDLVSALNNLWFGYKQYERQTREAPPESG